MSPNARVCHSFLNVFSNEFAGAAYLNYHGAIFRCHEITDAGRDDDETSLVFLDLYCWNESTTDRTGYTDYHESEPCRSVKSVQSAVYLTSTTLDLNQCPCRLRSVFKEAIRLSLCGFTC